MQNVIYTIRVTNNDFQPNRVAKILFELLQRNVQTLECHVVQKTFVAITFKCEKK